MIFNRNCIIAIMLGAGASEAFVPNMPPTIGNLVPSGSCFGTRSCLHPFSQRIRSTPGFKLRYSVPNNTAFINAGFNSTFSGGLNATSSPTRNNDITPEIKTLDLGYDQIQNIIDVSRPYYKLENEILVDTCHTRVTPTSQENESHVPSLSPTTAKSNVMPSAFCCTVDLEMPIGREQGSPVSFSEAGRHMAIAGSVAAALNKSPENSGKHYYLAMDCLLEYPEDLNKKSSAISAMHESLKATMLQEDDMDDDKIVISAVCNELTKKKATCQIIMHFPHSYGLGNKNKYLLQVTYSVLAPKVFQKFYPPLSLKDVDEMGNFSPYAQFKGLPFDSFEIISLSDSRIHVRNSSIQKEVPANLCSGHFDGNPALPIAFLATFCSDLSGKAISCLINKSIPFDKECAGPGRIKEGSDDRPVLKFVSCKVDAFKLVQAGTHGISLLCEVSKEEEGESSLKVYSSDVSVVAVGKDGDENENQDGAVVAKLNMKFELLD